MDDLTLIHQYLSGNEDALEKLLKNHLQKIFGACMRVCLNEQDAHDITQNVLIKIITHLKGFKKESNFSTWYYRIAYNESISYLKKKKGYTCIDDFTETLPSKYSFLEEIDSNIISQDVTKTIYELPLIDRNIILYYYYDNLKIREIAKLMNLNENTIKTRLSRTKKNLSTKLSHYETNY